MSNIESIKINIEGFGVREVARGVTLEEVAEDCKLERPTLLASVNHHLNELRRVLTYDCDVKFLDITDPNGFRAYQRGASFIMISAAKKVLQKLGFTKTQSRLVIAHSINKNYFCEFPNLEADSKTFNEILINIEQEMRQISQKNLPIEKRSYRLSEAARILAEQGLQNKERLLKYRRATMVNLYKLEGSYDYFYGPMPSHTKAVSDFKLLPARNGFILQFPSRRHNYTMAGLIPSQKIEEVFEESKKWARIIGLDSVASLNDEISVRGIGEIIRVTEALHEKKIAGLADKIIDENKRIVLIAGPSSSGKTTFASRLSVQLQTHGARPRIISLDNYYLNRENVPLDEHGKPDFETINSIDTPLINSHMADLLSGKEILIPTYNFKTGSREPSGKPLNLKKGDILILEGIHGLNEVIGAGLEASAAFRIFISSLTQLNIDDHNRIATTDARLIRRIVRDNHYRGANAARTLGMWESVMRGERKYIFPFQEHADAFFNSALIYEICILKQFAEPLLFSVDASEPESYIEAKRLLKFLDGFLGASSEAVPPNSLLREFIGGSCFK